MLQLLKSSSPKSVRQPGLYRNETFTYFWEEKRRKRKKREQQARRAQTDFSEVGHLVVKQLRQARRLLLPHFSWKQPDFLIQHAHTRSPNRVGPSRVLPLDGCWSYLPPSHRAPPRRESGLKKYVRGDFYGGEAPPSADNPALLWGEEHWGGGGWGGHSLLLMGQSSEIPPTLSPTLELCSCIKGKVNMK